MPQTLRRATINNLLRGGTFGEFCVVVQSVKGSMCPYDSISLDASLSFGKVYRGCIVGWLTICQLSTRPPCKLIGKCLERSCVEQSFVCVDIHTVWVEPYRPYSPSAMMTAVHRKASNNLPASFIKFCRCPSGSTDSSYRCIALGTLFQVAVAYPALMRGVSNSHSICQRSTSCGWTSMVSHGADYRLGAQASTSDACSLVYIVQC